MVLPNAYGYSRRGKKEHESLLAEQEIKVHSGPV